VVPAAGPHLSALAPAWPCVCQNHPSVGAAAAAAPRCRSLKRAQQRGPWACRRAGAAGAAPRCCAPTRAWRRPRNNARRRRMQRRRLRGGRRRQCSCRRCGAPEARRRRLFSPSCSSRRARVAAGGAQRRGHSRRSSPVVPTASRPQVRPPRSGRRQIRSRWSRAAGAHQEGGRERPCFFAELFSPKYIKTKDAHLERRRLEKKVRNQSGQCAAPPPTSPPLVIPASKRN